MSLNHLPLSRDTRAAFPAFADKANNPGLIFDRYTAYWEDWTLEPKKRMDPPNPKFATLDRIARVACDARLLAALSKRQKQLFDTLKAKTFDAHPEWRFITGLGSHSPLEVGFTFHRLYGIPIIAGSSLKGLTLAYAKYGLQIKDDELELIFGSQERAGAAIFFEALPIGIPQLELDVMNPHYPDWYQKQEPPANWQNPIPVFFLTVGKETVFRFAVGGRGKDGEAAKVKAHDWLKEALREMGAGAKTSAGYGCFSSVTSQEVEVVKQRSAQMASQPKPAPKATANPPAPQKKTTSTAPAGTATPRPVAKPIPKIRPGDKLRAELFKIDAGQYHVRLLEKNIGRELGFTGSYLPIQVGDTVEVRVKATSPAGDEITKIEFVKKINK